MKSNKINGLWFAMYIASTDLFTFQTGLLVVLGQQVYIANSKSQTLDCLIVS